MNFIHIPKTGGSSIKSMKINGVVCHPHETIASNLKDPKFAVIRDPLDRYISAFFFLKTHVPEFAKMEWTIEEFTDQLAQKNPKAVYYLFSPNFRFKDFCTCLKPVFTPQHFWVDEATKLIPFEQMPKAIEDKWGKKVPHENKSKRREVNFSPAALGWIKEFYSLDYMLYNRAKSCKSPYI